MEAFVELLLQMRSKEPTRIDTSEVNWLHKIYDQFALLNNMLSFSVESCVAVVTIRFTEAFTSSIDEATPAAQKLAHSEKKRKKKTKSFIWVFSQFTVPSQRIFTSSLVWGMNGYLFGRKQQKQNGNNTNSKKSLWKLLNLFNVPLIPREYFFFPLECIFLIKAFKIASFTEKKIIYTQFSSARCLLCSLEWKIFICLNVSSLFYRRFTRFGCGLALDAPRYSHVRICTLNLIWSANDNNYVISVYLCRFRSSFEPKFYTLSCALCINKWLQI